MKLFCPSCGNALEFRYDDSFVRVCDACHSAILRSDRGIDTLGKFADLAPASSGLVLQDAGRWQGQRFVLAGRAAYRHPAGGFWEEWYLKLADGRWAWLSYAEGRWALTFPSARRPEVPAFEAIEPGMRLDLGIDGEAGLTVAERNQASLLSAEGEIPFAFEPGAVGRFADLSDGRGRFATLDYGPPGSSEAPALYLGRQLAFAELGLPLRAPAAEPPANAAGERLACPNCGGSITLRVPGGSHAVACPYCASVLDCEGPLAILDRSVVAPSETPPIPLGARGAFEGTEYTVTGRLRRESRDANGAFQWDEYLLYAPGAGYRWLVCVQGHYSFVSELPPGTLPEGPLHGVRWAGREFALYDVAAPRVIEVFGEFYWKVRVGEVVQTRDYIAPPAMLSSEASENEIHWSLGVYQTQAEVRQAFGLPGLPDVSHGVAANQPFRHPHWRRLALGLGLALLLCLFIQSARGSARQVFAADFPLGGSSNAAASSASASSVFFTPPFELESGQNVRVELGMPLQNSWAFVAVDLIEEASGQLRTFDAELSYYSGVAGGERWSEGSRRASHVLSAGAKGSHLLRLEVQTPGPSRDPLAVAVQQGVLVWSQFGLALLALGLPAVGFLIYQYAFERARWSQSDHAPAAYAVNWESEDDD